MQLSQDPSVAGATPTPKQGSCRMREDVMDLQLFGEGDTGWDGAASPLPAQSDSGSLHISRLQKPLIPLNILLLTVDVY